MVILNKHYYILPFGCNIPWAFGPVETLHAFLKPNIAIRNSNYLFTYPNLM